MTVLAQPPAHATNLQLGEKRAIAACLTGLSENSKRAYRARIKTFLKWRAELSAPLSRESIIQYLEVRSADSPAVLSQLLSALKRLANECADNNWITFETAGQIDRIKTKKQKGIKKGNWITISQAQELINAPDQTTHIGMRDAALLALLIGCGLRRAELVDLRWNQIKKSEIGTNSTNPTQKSIGAQNTHVIFSIENIAGKGNRLRTITIPDWAAEKLSIWQRRWYYEQSDRVFHSITRHGYKSVRLSVSAVRNIVQKYAAQTGLEQIAPHDLRRTYAGLAHKGGASIEIIQQSLGHSSPATTQRYLQTTQVANAGDYIQMQTKKGTEIE